ncbi:MAG: tetratricopeptide repeat protein [Candidatus Thermoplasmatota archaeon]|nr:tetratricopeptide repeat protein [Candidatus Thermoplasmatota archaeon]
MEGEDTEAMYHFRQAYIKEISGDIDGAILELEKGTEGKAPQSVYMKLVELYLEKKYYEKALVKINMLLSVNPRNKEFRTMKIRTLKLMERFYEAYEEYEKILEQFPNEPENYLNEAEFLTEAGKLDEALSKIKRAVMLNPEDPELHIKEAEVLLEKERVDEAIECVTKAISYAPCIPDYYVLAGKLLDETGRFDDGEKYLIRAAEIRPHDLMILQDICEHFERKGDLHSAIVYYDKLIDLNPYEASFFFERGTLKEEMNNKAAAMEDYGKALTLDPENPQYSGRAKKLEGRA